MTTRRRIGLCLLLTAVSASGYLFWTRPRIDQRFARHWVSKMDPEEPSYEGFLMNPDGTMPGFKADLTWMGYFPGTGVTWRVRNDQLIITTQTNPWPANDNWRVKRQYLWSRASNAIWNRDPRVYARSVRRFQIVSVNPNLIELMELDERGHSVNQRELVPHESVYPR